MASLRVSVDCDENHEWRPTGLPPEAKFPRQHAWVEHLFESVSVVSQSRGRIRFHLAFEGDEVLTDTLRRELHKLTSVKLASYSVRTRNALVTFDPAQASEMEVASAVLQGVREFARTHGECDLTHHHHERARKGHDEHGHEHKDEEDCDHDHSHQVTDAGIRKELFKLVGTGLVLGYFVVKRLRATTVPVADSPLSLASFVTIASGYPIFRDGYRSVAKKGKATDDTLIGLAVSASLLMGESLTGLSVVWLIQLGRILEMITLKRSRTAVKELMDITPTEAWLVNDDDSVKKVSVESVRKGQILRVFHGEKVALDGKISRGTASVKESFLTGESIPRQKTVGDMVYAGSVVEAGEINVEVTNLIHDTVVATMIDAIENLRDRKAPIEKVGARFASKFVPISIGIATVTFIFTRDIRRAITMLVIACPCAAGLATPTAVSATIGQVARKGVLIKGGAHLETAARIDTIVFDKTGTLTLGAPVIETFEPTDKGSELGENEVLRLAASAEQHTTHPLGRVIVAEATTRTLSLSPADSFTIHEGLGVSATVDGKLVRVGSRRFLSDEGIRLAEGHGGDLDAGESELYVAVGKSHVGSYVVRDPVRPEAKEMLAKLESLGIKRFIMATGDQRAAAAHIAEQIGIKEYYAELLPTEKLELINRLKSQGRKVAMMGDGVNDAQALAQADLSIAMGTSRCDVAIETSDITISREDIRLVGELFDASKKTLRTIYQNFIAAVGINAGGIVYGAMGQLSPFSAAIVHNASTLAVVLNSLRLGRAVAGENPFKPLREVQI